MKKLAKLVTISVSVVVINLIWVFWVKETPVHLWVIIYITFLGVFHILSIVFYKGDIAERRRAMKTKKEQFISYLEKRFVIEMMCEALTSVDEIKAYCKKHNISESDTVIKNATDYFSKFLFEKETKVKEVKDAETHSTKKN